MTMKIQQLVWQVEAIREAFHTAVFVDADLDAATKDLDDGCVLETVPGVLGATGSEGVRRFLAEDVLGHLPSGLVFSRGSKTSDQRGVAHEWTVRFTHDRELPWLLPGVPPTGRDVETRAVSTASFRHESKHGVTHSRITAYRITWDRLEIMSQLGLLDRETVASG